MPLSSRAIKTAITEELQRTMKACDFLLVGEPPDEFETAVTEVSYNEFHVKVREDNSWRYFLIKVSEPF